MDYPDFRVSRSETPDPMTDAWLGTCGLLRFRPDLPREECARYWRDVHGPFVARTAGIHSYRQHHLDSNAPGWPAIDGVETVIPPDAHADGVAEATLHRPLRGMFSPVGRVVRRDEPNIFTGIRQYLAVKGRFSGRGPTPFGNSPDSPLSRNITFFRSRAGVRRPYFSARFLRVLEEALLAAPGAYEVREYRFHPYRPPLFRSQGIDYALPAGGEYTAAFVVAACDPAQRDKLMSIAASAVPEETQRYFCSAIHSFSVTRTYTLVQDGRATAAGIHGATNADTIARVRGASGDGRSGATEVRVSRGTAEGKDAT